jgi:hypothetical protein
MAACGAQRFRQAVNRLSRLAHANAFRGNVLPPVHIVRVQMRGNERQVECFAPLTASAMDQTQRLVCRDCFGILHYHFMASNHSVIELVLQVAEVCPGQQRLQLWCKPGCRPTTSLSSASSASKAQCCSVFCLVSDSENLSFETRSKNVLLVGCSARSSLQIIVRGCSQRRTRDRRWMKLRFGPRSPGLDSVQRLKLGTTRNDCTLVSNIAFRTVRACLPEARRHSGRLGFIKAFLSHA